MEKELSRIRRAVENMHQLMEALVALQRESNQCCRAVSLPQAPPVSQSTEPAGPDRSAECEPLYNRNEAAAFLLVHPRTVTRYRISGKLRFVRNADNQVRYGEEDLKDCYFWKWGKRP